MFACIVCENILMLKYVCVCVYLCVCVRLCRNKLWGQSPNTRHVPAPSVGLIMPRRVAKEDAGES